MAENEKAPSAQDGADEAAPKGAASGGKKPAAKASATTADKKAADKKPAAKKAADKTPAEEKPAATRTASGSTATAAKESAGSSATATTGNGGTLKMHHLRPAPGAHTAKTRVGRGESGKGGKTAGRGTKGTKARNQVPERFEGGQMPLHMRLPKLRGFKNPFRTEYQVVNLDALATLYPEGGEVTVDDLVAKGAVRKGAPVKVLGNGNVDVRLTVSVQRVSASAREKILAAGGSITQD